MSSIGDQLAAAAGLEVEFRSAHGPWLRWTPDDGSSASLSSSSGGGGSSWWERFFQPELTVHSAFGTVHKAPGGSPTGTTWPLLPIALGFVLVAVLTFAVAGVVSVVRGR